MLPRFKLAQLMWVVFLICTLSILGSGNAKAEEELASWYGPGFQGKPTANGETFDAKDYTAAHNTLPMGTELMVSYKGKTIPVTVNDRGPVSGDRDLDLSQGAAQALGLLKPGVDYVQVSCADGGNYPNCYMPPDEETTAQDDTTSHDDPTLQDNPTSLGDTTFLEDSAFQSSPAVQGDATFQDDTSLQSDPSFQGDAAVQSAPTFQGDPTVQSAPPVQQDPTFQGGAGGGMHVIQPGETLSGIAAQLGTSVDYLAMHNGISNPNLIYSGQALRY